MHAVLTHRRLVLEAVESLSLSLRRGFDLLEGDKESTGLSTTSSLISMGEGSCGWLDSAINSGGENPMLLGDALRYVDKL